MAEHYVDAFTNVASLTLAKNDTVTVGGDGFIYRVFEKMSTPSTSPLGAIKKQGSFFLVPISTVATVGTKALYDPVDKVMVTVQIPFGKFYSAATSNLVMASSKVTEARIQEFYNKETFTKITGPAYSTNINMASLYSELSGVTFSGYGAVLYHDKWFYGQNNFTACVGFNGDGKTDFGADIVWVAIPNR